jgi:hypothetical protein
MSALLGLCPCFQMSLSYCYFSFVCLLAFFLLFGFTVTSLAPENNPPGRFPLCARSMLDGAHRVFGCRPGTARFTQSRTISFKPH